jgi:hypothetical protein
VIEEALPVGGQPADEEVRVVAEPGIDAVVGGVVERQDVGDAVERPDEGFGKPLPVWNGDRAENVEPDDGGSVPQRQGDAGLLPRLVPEGVAVVAVVEGEGLPLRVGDLVEPRAPRRARRDLVVQRGEAAFGGRLVGVTGDAARVGQGEVGGVGQVAAAVDDVVGAEVGRRTSRFFARARAYCSSV